MIGCACSAKALLPAGTKLDYAAIESRSTGNFTEWEGRTIFVFENGQHWQVANADSYYAPAIKNPPVKVAPASFGGSWLTITGVSQCVRVMSVGAGK